MLFVSQGMLQRSIQRVEQAQQRLEQEMSCDAAHDDSRRRRCALLRAGELQVVASKADIEAPPVQQLQPVEWKTWTIPSPPPSKL